MRAPLLERQLDDGSSPGRRGLEPQGGLARVPQREPAADGAEPGCSRARRFVRDAGPVVPDGTDELRTVGQPGPHGGLAARGAHQRAGLGRVLAKPTRSGWRSSKGTHGGRSGVRQRIAASRAQRRAAKRSPAVAAPTNSGTSTPKPFRAAQRNNANAQTMSRGNPTTRAIALET